MAQQALYLRWRPSYFEDVVGQEHITYTLKNAIQNNRLGHAYLFSGPRGTGKTSMARLLAKAVNCLNEDPAQRPCNECAHCMAVNEGRFLDLIEIDAASHTGVDDVRELRDRISFAPNEGEYKVYIIDEVHRFSGAAFDALLKTIEEPPSHAIFVLATTEIHKVPQTIKSRCQRFDFRRIALDHIVERLRIIVDEEGMQADDAALELIARQGTGSMRDCISLLDQLLDPGEPLTLDIAQAILGTATGEGVQNLAWALIEGNTSYGLDLINSSMIQGIDPQQLTNQMVEHLRRLMLAQTGGNELIAASLSQSEMAVVDEQAARFPRRGLFIALKQFREAYGTGGSGGWQPQLPLEMAFLASVEAMTEPAPAPAAPARQAASAQQKTTKRKKKTAEPEAAPQEAAPPPSDFDPADVARRWEDVIRLSGQRNFAAPALLRSGQFAGVEGTTVIVQMPSEILKEKLEVDNHRVAVEESLRQIFGVQLGLVCRVGTAGGDAAPVAETDDLAQFAMNELGGTVTTVEDEEE